mmetsp:Transcript_6131/g.18504  ORF Transcript_6131/g.18504 Transcript_6131/m.18504 type:complete len:493 (-) Transcript_6131:327-1805(-)
MASPSDLEGAVLARLGAGAIEDSLEEAVRLEVEHKSLVGVVQSLHSDEYVTLETLSKSWMVATAEGEEILASGSPEYRVWAAVKEVGELSVKALEAQMACAKVGMGAAMKEKWLERAKGANGETLLRVTRETVEDTTRSLLARVSALSPEEEKALTRRKLASRQTVKYFKVDKGPKYQAVRAKKCADLSVEALKDGSWQTAEWKAYNFASVGERVAGGYVQPLLKVRAEFRKILMGMGFEEMPTNRWVESSFWNFDALFQPQSHPARDAHDTFFVKDPAEAVELPGEYYERVKAVHETGGYGSIGHRSPFDDAEAHKNLLRTHTTAVSARMLYALAQQQPFQPKRYFSIDRVFRNESMDSTHLCEFHQVEGLVADYDLSLSNLIATIRTFFQNIGITQLRFKPAFNPYTEPSMEVFGYHPTLKKWTEIGNSGIFRPEMLKPMGLPDNVRVIAWGLSLERPTMIKYKINNIRDLFGHKADIARAKATPMCIFP